MIPFPLPDIGLRIGMHLILANEMEKEFYGELLKKVSVHLRDAQKEHPFLSLDVILSGEDLL